MCKLTIESQKPLSEGYDKGETCNRNGCQGIIDEHEKEGCCSCHVHPPCGYCVEANEFCDTCGWDAKDEQDELDRQRSQHFKENLQPYYEHQWKLERESKGNFYKKYAGELPAEKLEMVTSDGTTHSAENLNAYREQKQKIRSSIQAKAATSKRSTTRNCRKLAKRLSGRERTHATIINHTIAKQLILSAKRKGKGVAIENLTNIRTTSKPEKRNKKFRTKLGKWSFSQLRSFIEYKGILFGVPVMVVNPRYTSQMCNVCKHIGKRTNKVFKCKNTNCEIDIIDADLNAAKNISSLGLL